eukprot:sb/3465998/
MDSRIERIFSEAIKVEAEGRSPHHSSDTKDGLDNNRPTSLAISPAPYYSVLRNSPINRNSPLTPRRSAAGRSRDQQQRLSADEVTPPPPPLSSEPINEPISGPVNGPITGASLPHLGRDSELPKPDSPTKSDFLEITPSESSIKSSRAVGEEIRYEVSHEDGIFAPPQSYYPHQAVFLPPAPPEHDDNSTSTSLPPPPLFQDHPLPVADPPSIPDHHQDLQSIPPHPHQDKVSLESLDFHQDNSLERGSYSYAPPISPTSSPPPPTTPPQNANNDSLMRAQYANIESGESDITIRDEEAVQSSHAEIVNQDELARNLKLEIVQFSQQQEQQFAAQKKSRRPRRKKDRSRTLSNGFESISRL